jgi:hypothetical protein
MIARALLVLMLLAATGVRAQVNEDALEAALAHWRAASWYVRIGNNDVAALEIESFREAWPAAGIDAPAIEALAETAALALETNDPPTAGRSLGAIGDTLAELRRQAGQSGFPEAMRAYRDAVVRLSGLLSMSEQRGGGPFDERVRGEVWAETSATAEAVARLRPLAPPRWAGDAKFGQLLDQNIDGVRGLLAALDRPSPRASGLEIAGLINVVRSNYYLMFLSYGY